MSAYLPLWIIGAPLVFAIVERFMTPAVTGSDGRPAATPPLRNVPAPSAARSF